MRLHARIRFASVLALGGALFTLGVAADQAQAGTTPALYFDTNGTAAGYGTAGTYSWDDPNWATATGGTSATTYYPLAQAAVGTTATYEVFNVTATSNITVNADEVMSGLQ